jgi:Ice-binding-like/Bacterial Ig-like domain
MKIPLRIHSLVLLSILFVAGCKKSDDPAVVSPTVKTTTPSNNATGVPRNNSILIEFGVAMDPATINATTVIVTKGTTVIPGTLSYSGTTAVFTPNDSFLALTQYTITITTGAKTAAGKAFDSNVVSNFTTGGTASSTARAVVELGTAGNYVILAKTAITSNPTSAITGDLGLSPAATSYVTGLALTNNTGFATSSQVTGKIYAADMVSPTPINLTTSVNNMITAYNDAAGRTIPDFVELGAGNIGGKTLTQGLYKWTSNVTVPTSITVSGSATDVWIFQISGNLVVSSAVNVVLSGGAQAKNIFWQVAGEATFGTTAHFEGVIMSQTGITFRTGASLKGRALAQTAVILDGNVVTGPQ